MRMLLLLALAGVCTASLPQMRYRFTSYATPAPIEAANFSVKYFGGQLVEDRTQWLTHQGLAPEAKAAAVRFHYNNGADFHDVYFVDDPTKPNGRMSVADYTSYLHGLHRFDLQETWDWYQDWHLGFAVDDVDLIVHRLLRDNISFVSRSHYSIYVEIPYGITFQFLGSKMALAWTEPFNFCRFTDGEAKYQPLQIKSLGAVPALPELPPSHHSYFSNRPDVAYNFTLKYTSGVGYNMSEVWKQSHEYSDGRCALLRWVQYPPFGYHIHFVDQYRKHEGNLTTKEVEQYLENLHGNMTSKDAFYDNRIGWEVDDLAPFQKALDEDGVRYYSDPSQGIIIIQIPGGILMELMQKGGPKRGPYLRG